MILSHANVLPVRGRRPVNNQVRERIYIKTSSPSRSTVLGDKVNVQWHETTDKNESPSKVYHILTSVELFYWKLGQTIYTLRMYIGPRYMHVGMFKRIV